MRLATLGSLSIFILATAPLASQEPVTRTFRDWVAKYRHNLMTDEKEELRLTTLSVGGAEAKLKLICKEGLITSFEVMYPDAWGANSTSAEVRTRFNQGIPDTPTQWKFGNLERLLYSEEARELGPAAQAALRARVELIKAAIGGAASATVPAEQLNSFVRRAMSGTSVVFEVMPGDAAGERQSLFSLLGMTAAMQWLGCALPPRLQEPRDSIIQAVEAMRDSLHTLRRLNSEAADSMLLAKLSAGTPVRIENCDNNGRVTRFYLLGPGSEGIPEPLRGIGECSETPTVEAKFEEARETDGGWWAYVVTDSRLGWVELSRLLPWP